MDTMASYSGSALADYIVNLPDHECTYPSTSSYDAASVTAGNSESVSIPAPLSGRWYYIALKAKQSFSGVTLGATYD